MTMKPESATVHNVNKNITTMLSVDMSLRALRGTAQNNKHIALNSDLFVTKKDVSRWLIGNGTLSWNNLQRSTIIKKREPKWIASP